MEDAILDGKSEMGATTIDEAQLEQFMGEAVGETRAIITASPMAGGEKLGMYRGRLAPVRSPPNGEADRLSRTDPHERRPHMKRADGCSWPAATTLNSSKYLASGLRAP